MRGGSRIRRAIVAAAVLLLAVTVLPGWLVVKRDIVFSGPFGTGRPVNVQTISQLDVIGDVQVQTTLCGSNNDSLAGCQNGNSAQAAPTDPMQFLVGYRISAAAQAPDTISANAGGTPITFSQNVGYTSQLTALLPPAAGQKWVGYLSAPRANLAAGQDMAVTTRFRLGRGVDGSPFDGPLHYEIVTGARRTPLGASETRPVQCGATPTAVGDGGTTWCVDVGPASSSPSTRDLGILGGAAGSGPAGTTVLVPFTTSFSGAADPSASFALSAATSVPGGAATPTGIGGLYVPGTDETRAIPVAVVVPPGTPVGTYTVTLSASVGFGASAQTRNAIGTVTVVPQQEPPAPGFTLDSTALSAAFVANKLRGTLTLAGSAAQPTQVNVTLFRRGRKKGAAPSFSRQLRLGTGSFRSVITLPATLAPGAYDLVVSPIVAGVAFAQQVRTVTIPGPAVGLVGSAVFSARAGGPAATRLRGVRHALHVRFVFSSLPRKGRAITVSFVKPDGRTTGPPVGKPRRRVVAAFVSSPDALPAGTWKAVLRVGKAVVKTATVRLG
jgi:hypothetical protein